MKYALGIDLGGTNIKLAALSQSGEIILRTTGETGEDIDRGRWAENVLAQIKSAENDLGGQADWLGLASPGIVAPDGRSMVAISGQLSALQNFDWADFLRPRRPALLNDAQAALLGEAAQGAAKGLSSAILITLGTGVGGAILADGRLLEGNLRRAGHFGHMCLDIDGEVDSNGVPGTLEEAIGNRTLKRRSGGLFGSTEQLVTAHLAGEENASRIWLRSVYQLACAVASLINIVDPEAIVIGGGIARAGDALFTPLSEYLEKMEWRVQENPRVPLLPALMGSYAGAVGAAFYSLTLNEQAQPS